MRRASRGADRGCRARRAGARERVDGGARRDAACATSASTGSRTCARRSGCSSSGRASFRRSKSSTGRTCRCPRRRSSGVRRSWRRWRRCWASRTCASCPWWVRAGRGRRGWRCRRRQRRRTAYPDGVFWAPLAPLRDPALVLPTVAAALSVMRGKGQLAGRRSGAGAWRSAAARVRRQRRAPDAGRRRSRRRLRGGVPDGDDGRDDEGAAAAAGRARVSRCRR